AAEGWIVDDFRILVPAPLSAAFSAPATALTGGAVAFQDQSNGHLGGWLWDFGDGGSSTVENPTHVYAAAGSYVVRLTVRGRAGLAQEPAPRAIAVYAPVVAAFSGAPTSGRVPLAVSFADASSGAPVTWLWTFGDGATSAARNPLHTFAARGTYSVALTA